MQQELPGALSDDFVNGIVEYVSSRESAAYEFDVFISYRTNLIPDGPAGEELQRVLESYPVPATLRGNLVVPKRFRNRLRVFRDITDLNAGGEISEAIREKLRVSRWLVVVCSPNTPRSAYCLEEISYFESLHGSNHTLYLLIAGEAHESIPAVASVRTARAVPEAREGGEPLAADVRASNLEGILAKLRGDGLAKSGQARFKLLAPILGCDSPDDLIRRHRARVRRLALQTVAAALPVAIGAGGFAARLIQQETTRLEAERLLAPIGLEDWLTAEEVSALWKVAASDRAVRLEFLRQAVNVSPRRFNRRAEMITRAAVGIDPSLAKAVEEGILRPLSGSEPKPPDLEISRRLLGLSLPIRDPVFVADGFKALVTLPEFKGPWIMKEAAATEPLEQLAAQFWRRVGSLDPSEAKAATREVLRLMKSIDDPAELSRWAVLLRELGVIDPETLRIATTRMRERSRLPADSSGREREFVSGPHCQLWGEANWDFSSDDVRAFTPLLVACLQSSKTVLDTEEWTGILVRLLNRTPVSARPAATPILLSAMQAGSLTALDTVLVDVPGMLTEEFRKRRVNVILDSIDSASGQDSAFDLERLAQRLAALPTDVSEDELAKARTILFSALGRKDEKFSLSDGLRVGYVLKAIASLPGTPPASMYWPLAARIVELMKAADGGSSTTVDMQEIAEAAAGLPQPPGKASDGAAVHTAIIEQIEKISFNKLFSNDRLRAWLLVLRATGGDLPVARQEALARSLIKKIDAMRGGFDVDELFKAVFALQTDRASAGRVVSEIINICESDVSCFRLNLDNLRVKDWPASLSAEDYAEAVRRVAKLLGGARNGSSRDLLTLLARLPKVDGQGLKGIQDRLLGDIESHHELSALRRVHLRAAVLRRLPSTSDLADDELVVGLKEAQTLGTGGLEYPASDRQRVVDALIAEIERGGSADAVYATIRVLHSTGHALGARESRRVIDSLASALTRAGYESGIKAASELLSGMQSGLDETSSAIVVNAVIKVMLDANDSQLAWHAADLLDALPIAVSPNDTSHFAERICAILEGNSGELSFQAWYRVLAKVARQLSPEHRHRAATPVLAHLAKLMTPAKEEDRYSYDLKELLQALTRIPGGLVPDDQREVWQLVLTILASDSYAVENFPVESSEEIAMLSGGDVTRLVELLKWPTLSAAVNAEVIALIEKQSKQMLRGDVWRAASWAQSNGLNVSAPISRLRY